jgi:hypothetical protein
MSSNYSYRCHLSLKPLGEVMWTVSKVRDGWTDDFIIHNSVQSWDRQKKNSSLNWIRPKSKPTYSINPSQETQPCKGLLPNWTAISERPVVKAHYKESFTELGWKAPIGQPFPLYGPTTKKIFHRKRPSRLLSRPRRLLKRSHGAWRRR